MVRRDGTELIESAAGGLDSGDLQLQAHECGQHVAIVWEALHGIAQNFSGFIITSLTNDPLPVN